MEEKINSDQGKAVRGRKITPTSASEKITPAGVKSAVAPRVENGVKKWGQAWYSGI